MSEIYVNNSLLYYIFYQFLKKKKKKSKVVIKLKVLRLNLLTGKIELMYYGDLGILYIIKLIYIKNDLYALLSDKLKKLNYF